MKLNIYYNNLKHFEIRELSASQLKTKNTKKILLLYIDSLKLGFRTH